MFCCIKLYERCRRAAQIAGSIFSKIANATPNSKHLAGFFLNTKRRFQWYGCFKENKKQNLQMQLST
jgi:hypothetical protein